MLFQLTTEGRDRLNSDPAGIKITQTIFGSDFGYTLDLEPTGIKGEVVIQNDTTWDPTIMDGNTLRYTVFLAAELATLTFGEIALYSNGLLIAVGVNPTQLVKLGPMQGDDGFELRVDIFIDTDSDLRYVTADVVNSRDFNSFPRFPTVDLLIPPGLNDHNVFLIYGYKLYQQPFLAYVDATGCWSFSTKPQLYFRGTVTDIDDEAMYSLNGEGLYNGDPTHLVLQFVTGKQRGYCRTVTKVIGQGGQGISFQWNSALLERPEPGDQFRVVGPLTATDDLIGGQSLLHIFTSYNDLVSIRDEDEAIREILSYYNLCNRVLRLEQTVYAAPKGVYELLITNGEITVDCSYDHFHLELVTNVYKVNFINQTTQTKVCLIEVIQGEFGGKTLLDLESSGIKSVISSAPYIASVDPGIMDEVGLKTINSGESWALVYVKGEE